MLTATRWGVTPAAFSVSAIRVGPSRLISTALSRGESNATAAAEWITMSQPVNVARSASLRPRPSVLTSPATATHAPGDHRLERFRGVFELGAQPVEGVVLEDLAADPLGHVVALARPHQQHQFALGNRPQQPLDQRSADESGATRDGDALVGKVLADHSGTCLAHFVYHLVETS